VYRIPAAKEHFAMDIARMKETTRSSLTTHSQANLTAGAAPPLLRQALPGQPALLAGYRARLDGPPCEIASHLCARCEALAALEPELARLNAYNAMIMEVSDVRDDEKGRVISMLLAQLALLPEGARMDALRDASTLAGGAGAEDQAWLYAQIARAGALLPLGERAAALRSMLLKAGSLGLDGRANLLAALAGALSSLPDADAQKPLLTLLCSALDRLPTALRLPVLEALAAADLKSEALRLVGFTAASDSMQADQSLASFNLLTQLAGKLSRLPLPARVDAFETVLKFCSALSEVESADVKALLHLAIACLPDTEHLGAKQAMARAGTAPAPGSVAAGAVGKPEPVNLAAFNDALALVCNGSPVMQEARLFRLAADLDRVTPAERYAAFSALMNVALALEPDVRDRLLSRAAEEICMLAEDERLPAWSALATAAATPGAPQPGRLLAALAGEIHLLPETSRAQACATLLQSGGAGADLSAASAWLPESERMAAFRLAPTPAALAAWPAARRYEAWAQIQDVRMSARLLEALPEPALAPAVRLLISRARGDGKALTVLVRGLADYSERLPMTVIYLLLEAAVEIAKDMHVNRTKLYSVNVDAWLKILDFAVPVLLRQSGATLKSLAVPGNKQGSEKDLSPPRLVIETCQILCSTRTESEKSQALRSMKPTPPLYWATEQPDQYWSMEDYPTAHHMAAFVVPLLCANLPEQWLCEHLTSKSPPYKADNSHPRFKAGHWHTALSGLASRSHALFDILFRLILRSGLSSHAKSEVLAGLSGTPTDGECSVFQMLDFKPLYRAEAAFPALYIRQVLDSDLEPQHKTRLLLGYAKPANEKSPYKSSVLLKALQELRNHQYPMHSEGIKFLGAYVMEIACSTLPDDCKRQLLTGCHAYGSDEDEFKPAMASVAPGVRQLYAQLIRMSALPEAIKKELLLYC
jgi:hypothetical protein